MSFPAHCLHLQAAKVASGLTFAEIAEKISKPEVWTAALFYGSAVTDRQTAHSLIEALGPQAATFLSESEKEGKFTISALVAGLSGAGPENLGVNGMLVRGRGWEVPPKDPVIYRLYEVLVVYGWTYKALINEKFGDGIMSAIDFFTSVERVPHPKGDRVKITMSGKFLPYSGTDSWATDK